MTSAFESSEAAIESRDELMVVINALAKLSPVDREIIVLFAWEQLSYDEIAVVMDVALGTVRSRLARARKHLRELAGLSDELTDDVR